MSKLRYRDTIENLREEYAEVKRPRTRSQRPTGAPVDQSGSKLLHLPNELLFRIGEFLEPRLTPELWSDSGEDLKKYTAVCRRLRTATEGLRARISIICIDSINSLSAASKQLRALVKRNGDGHKVRRLVIEDNDFVHSGWMDINPRRMAWNNALVDVLGKLPKLEFFSYIRDIDNATQTSPYAVTEISRGVIRKLAGISTLRGICLCGVRMAPSENSALSRPPLDDASDVAPPPALDQPIADFELPVMAGPIQYLHLLAIEDSMLELVNKCPQVTHLRIWRDFLIESKPMVEWFQPEHWGYLEEVQLKGFTGNAVRELQQDLGRSRQAAESRVASFPLRCLDFDENWAAEQLLEILPYFRSDSLRIFKATFWKNGAFHPQLLETIATIFPNVEELHIGLETLTLRWWPYTPSQWGTVLSHFKQLRTLRWNATPYVGYLLKDCACIMAQNGAIIAKCCPSLELIELMDSEKRMRAVRNQNNVAMTWETPDSDKARSKGEHNSGTAAEDESDSTAADDIVNYALQASGPVPPKRLTTLQLMAQAKREEEAFSVASAGPSLAASVSGSSKTLSPSASITNPGDVQAKSKVGAGGLWQAFRDDDAPLFSL